MFIIDKGKVKNIDIDDLKEENKRLYENLKKKAQFNGGRIATYNEIMKGRKIK